MTTYTCQVFETPKGGPTQRPRRIETIRVTARTIEKAGNLLRDRLRKSYRLRAFNASPYGRFVAYVES